MLEEKCQKILESLQLNDYQNVLANADCILYEHHKLLERPDELFSKVKEIILELHKKRSFNEHVKVNIWDALNDRYCKQFQDDDLYASLIDLFKNKSDAYFTVKLGSMDSPYEEGDLGTFSPPEKFSSFLFNEVNQYSLPKIQPIAGIADSLVKSFCERFNELVDQKQKHLTLRQNAIKAFNATLTKDSYFGEIMVNVDLIDEKKEDLDDVICHECQHLCIFLLSLAKTCNHFAMHYSNNSRSMSYELKESEFFTLAHSYIKILIRRFKESNYDNCNDFIHAFLDHALNEKHLEIFSDSQIDKISRFYKLLYEDENLTNHIRTMTSKGVEKVPITKKMKSKKFTTLMKWTIDAFERNIKEV